MGGFPCQIVDVSPVGVAIRGPLPGDLGERVVAYVEALGRIEGVIVRRSADGFALDLRVPSHKVHELAARIGWLVRRKRKGCPSGAATSATIKIKSARRCSYRTGESSQRL